MTTWTDITPLITAAYRTMTDLRADRLARLTRTGTLPGANDALDRHHEAEQIVLAVLDAQRRMTTTT